MTRCACKRPKPATETCETFDGLFVDEPIAREAVEVCDRCDGIIKPWHPTTEHA